MENFKITFRVKINTGKHIGSTIEIDTDIEELEELSLSSMLIEKGYLQDWGNSNEYTVIRRKLTIETNT